MEKLKLLLQMFAEDESDEPTEEVENPSEEDDEEGELNLDDEESEEPVEEEQEDTTTKKKRQENYNNAQLRLQKKEEKRKAEEKLKRDGYIEGIKKSSNGRNRFTGKAIQDEFDVEEYETMLEMEEKGLDPIEDYSDYVKTKQRAERQKQLETEAEQQDQQEKIKTDLNSFVSKYGRETAEKILNDKEFNKFSEGLLGSVPLELIYEKFLNVQATLETRAEKMVIEKEARRTSSTKKLGNSNEPASKSIKDMSDEEFAEFLNSIK